MIRIERSPDLPDTFELVTDDSQAEAVNVQEALTNTVWRDSWDDATMDDGFIRIRFDASDKIRLTNKLLAHEDLQHLET